jgi:hypothetical protein
MDILKLHGSVINQLTYLQKYLNKMKTDISLNAVNTLFMLIWIFKWNFKL